MVRKDLISKEEPIRSWCAQHTRGHWLVRARSLLGIWAAVEHREVLKVLLASSWSEEPDSVCGRKERGRVKELVSKAIAVRVPAPTHRWLPEVTVCLFFSLANVIPFRKCPLIISG